jgi:hypothetical protein
VNGCDGRAAVLRSHPPASPSSLPPTVCRQRRAGGACGHHRRLRLCADVGGDADWFHCWPGLLRSKQVHSAQAQGALRLRLRLRPAQAVQCDIVHAARSATPAAWGCWQCAAATTHSPTLPAHLPCLSCPALPCPPAQIDDPLDAIAVHAGGGMWGMLGCAAFAAPNLVTDWYGAMPPSGGVVAPGAEQAQVRLGGRLGLAAARWAASHEMDGAGSLRGTCSPWPLTPPPPCAVCPACPPCLLRLQRNYGFIMGGNGNLLAAHIIYILGEPGWAARQGGRQAGRRRGSRQAARQQAGGEAAGRRGGSSHSRFLMGVAVSHLEELLTTPSRFSVRTRSPACCLPATSCLLAVIAVWVAGIMTPFFVLLKRLGLMRVSPGVRMGGLLSLDGGPAWIVVCVLSPHPALCPPPHPTPPHPTPPHPTPPPSMFLAVAGLLPSYLLGTAPPLYDGTCIAALVLLPWYCCCRGGVAGAGHQLPRRQQLPPREAHRGGRRHASHDGQRCGERGAGGRAGRQAGGS